MRRLVRLVSFILFAVLAPFAGAAAFGSLKRVNVLDTEHFSVYFTDPDFAFACRVQESCEKALSDLNGIFGTLWEPKGFPIVITSDVQILNAYYTAVTTGHITLYNTLSEEGELDCFENTHYSILLHELAHALTLSVKSPAMDFFSLVIGEAFDNTLFLNFAMTEGLAVMVESVGGDGRANSAFAMNPVLQGIREGSMLSYRRASAPLSRRPIPDTGYVFTGAFLKSVYEKYGKDRMTHFANGISTSVSVRSLFKDAFGISMDAARENFTLSFKFPETVKSQRLINRASDYSIVKKGLDALFFADDTVSEIYRFDENGVSPFFSCQGIVKFDFNAEGDVMGLIMRECDGLAFKAYSVSRSGLHHLMSLSGVRDFAFAKSQDKDILALLMYDGTTLRLDFLDFDTGELVGQHYFSPEEEIYGLLRFEDGNIAFVSQKKLSDRICAFDVRTHAVQEFENSEDVLIRNLSYDSSIGSFVFSYAYKGIDPENVHYPRLGLLYKGNEGWEYSLFQDDLDGGVLCPQILGGNLVFKSQGYRQDEIRWVAMSDLSSRRFPVAITRIEPAVEAVGSGQDNSGSQAVWKTASIGFSADFDKDSNRQEGVRRHSAFVKSLPFASSGLLLPTTGSEDSAAWIGLDYRTSDVTERFSSLLSVHRSLGEKKHWRFGYAHALATRSVYSSLGIFPYVKMDDGTPGDMTTHFDFKTAADVQWIRRFSSERNRFVLYARVVYDIPMYDSSKYVRDGLGFDLAASYADVVSKGYGNRNDLGWQVFFKASVSDVNSYFKDTKHLFFLSFGVGLDAFFPRLIPVQNTRKLTYSLPVSLELSAFYKYTPYHRNAKTDVNSLSVALSANVSLFSVNLSEDFIDIPFVVEQIAIEFLPRARYLNYANASDSGFDAVRGFAFDFNFQAYLRLRPTFLGRMITANAFDVGVGYAIGQKSPSAGFEMHPYFYFALNGAVIFGGLKSDLEDF